jgi:hypothetical protein
MISGCEKSAITSCDRIHRDVTSANAAVVMRQTSMTAITLRISVVAVMLPTPDDATISVKNRLSLAVPIKPMPNRSKITPRPASKRLASESGTSQRFATARQPAKIARAVAQWRDTRPKPKSMPYPRWSVRVGAEPLLVGNLALFMGYSLD